MMLVAKMCSTCHRILMAEEFSPDQRWRTGRQARCKRCANSRVKQWRDANRDRYRENQEAWSARNPERVKEYRKRDRERYWEKGRTPHRRAVDRKNNLRKFYGLSVADYDEMFAAQVGLCALCGRSETQRHHLSGEVIRLAVDHDHATGEVRGLLCRVCNQMVGRVEKVGLERFADYLGGKRGRG